MSPPTLNPAALRRCSGRSYRRGGRLRYTHGLAARLLAGAAEQLLNHGLQLGRQLNSLHLGLLNLGLQLLEGSRGVTAISLRQLDLLHGFLDGVDYRVGGLTPLITQFL